MKKVKGYRGGRKCLFRTAKESLYRALQYSYTGRKRRKRDFRRLWIIRINAALQNYGISYSKFIGALKKANIQLNRKQLSEMAIANEKGFSKIVELAKKNLSAS